MARSVWSIPKCRLLSRPVAAVQEQEAIERMIYIMINEAAMILQEKVVDGPDTVDIGMIMGTGFPPFRGGLLRYADSIGIDQSGGWYGKIGSAF